MAAEQELGAIIERYETDNRRRKRIFVVAVPLGAIVAGLGAVLLLVIGGPGEAAGVAVVPGVVGGLGLGAVGVGIWQGWLSFTRVDEVFTLHEDGLVHSYAGKSRAIHWDEIIKVTDQSTDRMFSEAVGMDIRYRIKLKSAVGGRRIMVITGLTEDAIRLGEIVRHAAQRGAHPKPETA